MFHGNGTEFKLSVFKIPLGTCGVELKPTAMKNPISNSIMEIIYLIMGDILRTDNFANLNWQKGIDTLL